LNDERRNLCNAANEFKVVVLYLEFAPGSYSPDMVSRALIAIGQNLKASCSGLFQHWRASRHGALGSR